MSLQLNQFSMTPLKGALALIVNPFTISVQLDAASGEDFILPGDYVKLVDATGPQIIVDKADADEVALGAVIWVPKTEKFYPGQTLEIASTTSIMWMEASAAIVRGAELEFVPTGAKVKTNTGNPVCGIALDNAAGSGSLLRVLVLNPVSIPLNISGGSINGTAIGGSSPSTGVFTDLTSTGTTLLGNAVTDVITLTGVVTVTGTIAGATPFVFEGATADANEGTLAVADFSADQTFTIPDATGTFDLHHQTPLVITPGSTPSYAPGASHDLATLTPGEAETIAAVTTGAVVGKTYRIKIVTSGASSFTLTFGTNFLTTGTLATGVTTAKTFVMSFVFDGTNFVEVGRTTAM